MRDAACPTAFGGTVRLDEGQHITCTITNDDQAASLTLVKAVINDNGGNAGANDFGLSVGGAPVNSGDTTTLDANTAYALDEAGLSGYTFVGLNGQAPCPGALGGTGTLNQSQPHTSPITNDHQAARPPLG